MPLAHEAFFRPRGANLALTFIDIRGNPSVAQQQARRLISQDKMLLSVRRLSVVLHIHRDADCERYQASVRGCVQRRSTSPAALKWFSA